MSTYKEQRNQEILQNLKTILNRRELSQRDFALMLGKKESEISRWFSGKFCISKKTQNKIENTIQEPISSDSQYRIKDSLIKIGIVGTGNIAEKFISEMPFVENGKVIAAYNPDNIKLQKFCIKYNVEYSCSSLEEIISLTDIIYIASPMDTHAEYAQKCLLNKKHVLCEMPFTCTKEEAENLYQIAEQHNCSLVPALKTAFCPSFLKMNEIAKSGIIGEISDISATVTTLLSEDTPTDFYNERLYENATYPIMAIFKLLGVNYRKIHIFNKKHEGKILFSNINMIYNNVTASLKVGTGVKSEGILVISGTNGYIYVPAPWWKMDYFEVRFENQNDNKKFFFPYEASGLRYEIQASIDSINKNENINKYITKKENIKIIEIQNKISNLSL